METRKYDRVTIALHWLIGAALLAQIVFGFLLDDIAPRSTPARGAVINLHKSTGIVLGLAIVLRLLWRLRHQPPAWPASMQQWQRRAATLGHRALYICMLVMPVSGYVASNFSAHGVKFFGKPLAPWGPDIANVYGVFNTIHVVTAWMFTTLIVGHILIALKHRMIDKDGMFSRMLPWRTSVAETPSVAARSIEPLVRRSVARQANPPKR